MHEGGVGVGGAMKRPTNFFFFPFLAQRSTMDQKITVEECWKDARIAEDDVVVVVVTGGGGGGGGGELLPTPPPSPAAPS